MEVDQRKQTKGNPHQKEMEVVLEAEEKKAGAVINSRRTL